MSLAQRLNELAVANAQGLLNDDEYRLLRQNVFEQFSGSVIVPVEAPIVPIARVQVPKASSGQRRTPVKSKPNPAEIKPKLPPTPSSTSSTTPTTPRTKHSIGLNVVNLFRKATGRKTSNPTYDQHTSKTNTRQPNGSINHESFMDMDKGSKLRAITPTRLISKKAIPDLPPLILRTNVSQVDLESPRSQDFPTRSYQALPSPNSASGKMSSASFYSKSEGQSVQSISVMHDVYDESNLLTARDIINAIASTEDEARKLVGAFDDLEASVVRRIQKKNARRRLIPRTPTNVSVVMSGQEWREHRLLPSPSSPTFDSMKRQHQRYRDTLTSETSFDGVSIRSAASSSNKTSMSQAKSIPSLPKIVPSSPLSANFRIRTSSSVATSGGLARKDSISSVSSSSQVILNPTTTSSGGMLGVSAPSSPSRKLHLSRSASRLGGSRRQQQTVLEPPDSPLTSSYTTYTADMSFPDSTILEEEDLDEDDSAELEEIRKRRDDVVARCKARLEFLRAKLKGAQLREKLLKK